MLLIWLIYDPELWISCSPEPQELWQNRPDQTVDQDVGPDQLARELEGLEAGVVEQEETGPEQQQVEQTHKPWKIKTKNMRPRGGATPAGVTFLFEMRK